jgi:hypothetical protein
VAKLDDEYIARMEEVLELYQRPLSSSEPVIRMDEKPVVQHRDMRRIQPMYPGRAAQPDEENKRCETANMFSGVERKVVRHFTKVNSNSLWAGIR